MIHISNLVNTIDDFKENRMSNIEFRNPLKEKILKGQVTLGTFHELISPNALELEAYAGMDYLVIDTEHGAADVESTQELIRACKLANATPLVRVKDGERNSILKMLDIGAMGLIIPDIKSREEVEKVISYGKYPPLGNRGVAPSPGSHYWTQDYMKDGLQGYFDLANNNQLLLAQCETRECLEDIEAISQINGLDGIFVGPFDLSVSMGIAGQFSHPEFIKAIDRILKACKEANILSFIYVPDIKTAKSRIDQGFQSITYSMDALILHEAVKRLVDEIKNF